MECVSSHLRSGHEWIGVETSGAERNQEHSRLTGISRQEISHIAAPSKNRRPFTSGDGVRGLQPAYSPGALDSNDIVLHLESVVPALAGPLL
jgi:hypothetical protein